MSVQEDNSQYVPKPSPYGRIIREKGTRRVLLLAALVFILYNGYGYYRTYSLNQMKWPALQASTQGLIVLGLQDKERPGHIPRYKAYEVNKSWQIRYTEEADPSEKSQEEDAPDQDETSTRPDGAPNAGSRGGGRGSVVPMPELLRECPKVLNGSHFSGASLEERADPLFERKYWLIHLNLTEEGRSRYWQFASKHADERAVFVLNNEVITCPRMANMFVTTLTIEPVWVKADAQKLADFINGQKR
jgi:hypothetical protein